MTKNVGMIDRIARAAVGIVLIAYALSIGFPATGWNWVGWIGVIPLVTAFLGNCPLYTVFGLSACPVAARPR
jgi:hypothetical protein